MKDFFIKLNDQAAKIIEPYWNKVLAFLSKEYYVVYAAISLLLALLILPGLFTCLKKMPKLFFLIVVLLGVIVALWYFFVKK